jgi:broad specificity phosphatase PhoE
MQLYIIRHGQSSNNALADFSQRTFDPILTPLGQQQAEAVADYLASGRNLEQLVGATEEETGVKTEVGFHLTHLYCSAMYRALQTARPIGQAVGLNPEVWVDIHEGGGMYLDTRTGGPRRASPQKPHRDSGRVSPLRAASHHHRKRLVAGAERA